MERYITVEYESKDNDHPYKSKSYKSFDSMSGDTKELFIIDNVRLKQESVNDEYIIYWFGDGVVSLHKENFSLTVTEITKKEFNDNWNKR